MSKFARTEPLGSVIMGACNAAPTLRKAMDSILAQTFQYCEFVICDDGPTHSTLAIAEEYARRDARIVVLSSPANRSAPTLNTCLAHSRGLLIARMEANDRCRPDRLDRQVAFVREHPEALIVSRNGSKSPGEPARSARPSRAAAVRRGDAGDC